MKVGFKCHLVVFSSTIQVCTWKVRDAISSYSLGLVLSLSLGSASSVWDLDERISRFEKAIFFLKSTMGIAVVLQRGYSKRGLVQRPYLSFPNRLLLILLIHCHKPFLQQEGILELRQGWF